MADWGPLRERLSRGGSSVTLTWGELDTLVGGLPVSALTYRAFWSGDRTMWRGFRAVDVRMGRSVTFERTGDTAATDPAAPSAPTARRARPAAAGFAEPDTAHRRPPAHVVLVGCVKSKRPHSAPAKDLYVSAYFHKMRLYAERVGRPWYVLSAQHGLVRPDDLLEPYDCSLPRMSAEYRRTWGEQVAEQLHREVPHLSGKIVEIHAGAAYVDAATSPIEEFGAIVTVPLDGLTLGERLAWYLRHEAVPLGVDELVSDLTDPAYAVTPADVLARGRETLNAPGMYSWWVDPAGAADLSRGLGHPVAPGLVYLGLAGAIRRGGTPSSNTLWGRIAGMHLGGNHRFSTFRHTLGSVLAAATGADHIDEELVSRWMTAHLRVVAVPVADSATLDAVETSLLADLDPPLNLAKVPVSPLRSRLSELRRRYRD